MSLAVSNFWHTGGTQPRATHDFRLARQPSTWARDPHSYTMVRVDNVQIRPVQASDLDQLARLCEALWPKSSAEEHAQELRLLLGGKAALVLTMPLTIFVAEVSDGTLVGFLEVDLRSHADGCNPSQAVGYIEGWFVGEDYRHRGVGKKLLAKAEDWARSHRCLEMRLWPMGRISQAFSERRYPRLHVAVAVKVKGKREGTEPKRCYGASVQGWKE